MPFLWIDEGKCIENEKRNWEWIKEFFEQKLFEWKDYKTVILESVPNGIDELKAAL